MRSYYHQDKLRKLKFRLLPCFHLLSCLVLDFICLVPSCSCLQDLLNLLNLRRHMFFLYINLVYKLCKPQIRDAGFEVNKIVYHFCISLSWSFTCEFLIIRQVSGEDRCSWWRVFVANFIVRSSKRWIWYFSSLFDHKPFVLAPWHTAHSIYYWMHLF